jgi:hypothetical protein
MRRRSSWSDAKVMYARFAGDHCLGIWDKAHLPLNMELRGGAEASLDNVVLLSKGSGISFKLVIPQEVQSRVLAMELTLCGKRGNRVRDFEATIIGPETVKTEGRNVRESLLVGNLGTYAFKSQALDSSVTLGGIWGPSWDPGDRHVIALVINGSNSTATCFHDATQLGVPMYIGQVNVLPAQSCVELAFTNNDCNSVKFHWIGLWGTALSGKQFYISAG